MQKLLWVLLGGAIGTGFRYGISAFINSTFKQPAFPYATFLINISGSFLIGLLAQLFDSKFTPSPVLRVALMTGVLGGYTTFSSFSLETYNLLRDNRLALAFAYAAGSVVLGLLAAWGGIRLAQSL